MAPFSTISYPERVVERPICPTCGAVMRLVWIAANEQDDRDRHTLSAPPAQPILVRMSHPEREFRQGLLFFEGASSDIIKVFAARRNAIILFRVFLKSASWYGEFKETGCGPRRGPFSYSHPDWKKHNEQRVSSLERLGFRIVASSHGGGGDTERHSASFDAHCRRRSFGSIEPTRMGAEEKVQALGEAQAVAPVGSMTGRNRRHVAKKSMTGRIRRRKSMAGRNRRHIAKKAAGVYKKRVRGNRRRLAR